MHEGKDDNTMVLIIPPWLAEGARKLGWIEGVHFIIQQPMPKLGAREAASKQPRG